MFLLPFSTENRAYDTNLCTKLIDSIQMPNLKLYLITKFVGDVNQHAIVLNPRSIRTALIKLKRTGNADINANGNEIDHNKARTHSVLNEDAADDYPFMKMVRKKCSSSIDDRDYARLLIVALVTYADIHHIEEFERICSRADQLATDSKQYESELPALKKKKLKVFNKQTMRKLGPALIAKQMETAKNERTYEHQVIHPVLSLSQNVEIFMDLEMQERYREDVKLYEIIKLDEYDVVKDLLPKDLLLIRKEDI